jgi:hypothetical protein
MRRGKRKRFGPDRTIGAILSAAVEVTRAKWRAWSGSSKPAARSETRMLCAAHLGDPDAKCYDLSHAIANTMPMSPYNRPLTFATRKTRGMRNSVYSSNMGWH